MDKATAAPSRLECDMCQGILSPSQVKTFRYNDGYEKTLCFACYEESEGAGLLDPEAV